MFGDLRWWSLAKFGVWQVSTVTLSTVSLGWGCNQGRSVCLFRFLEGTCPLLSFFLRIFWHEKFREQKDGSCECCYFVQVHEQLKHWNIITFLNFQNLWWCLHLKKQGCCGHMFNPKKCHPNTIDCKDRFCGCISPTIRSVAARDDWASRLLSRALTLRNYLVAGSFTSKAQWRIISWVKNINGCSLHKEWTLKVTSRSQGICLESPKLCIHLLSLVHPTFISKSPQVTFWDSNRHYLVGG